MTKDDRIAELETEVAELKQLLAHEVDETAVHVLHTRLKIPPARARMLLALYQAKGRALQSWTICDAVRRHVDDYALNTNIVAVYATSIRKALGNGAVEAVRNFGYRLTPAGLAAVSALLAECAPFFTVKLEPQGAPLRIPEPPS